MFFEIDSFIKTIDDEPELISSDQNQNVSKSSHNSLNSNENSL